MSRCVEDMAAQDALESRPERTLDDVAEVKSSGQLKTKSRDGYQKFTVVREAAAEANARTSAETERSLPRSLTHLSDERAFSSSKICFLLAYENLKTHVVIVALSLISACSRNLYGGFEKGQVVSRNRASPSCDYFGRICFYVMHTAHSTYEQEFHNTSWYTHTRNTGRYVTTYKRVQNTRSAQVMACDMSLIITGFENTAYYCKIYLLPYQQTNNYITLHMQKCQRTIYDGLSRVKREKSHMGTDETESGSIDHETIAPRTTLDASNL
ncbi:hypothetical protein G5I_09643 [Acromyrmex echinatior]|uniref:Uncharacterized protein n=1 Tax=Acromyrmex echinatior TaxID=103372 RepID=F4WUR6_ACREC|nr:hypothetical protein G5I_09643 [Acromyrmex echinatior]